MSKLSTNLSNFNRQLRDFTDKRVPDEIIKIQRKISLEALRRIILRTPVDTGLARGNWQLTINSPTDAVLTRVDASGGSAISAGISKLANIPPFTTIYIQNNLDYILNLEHGPGMSTQAPNGMVAITIEELGSIFR